MKRAHAIVSVFFVFFILGAVGCTTRRSLSGAGGSAGGTDGGNGGSGGGAGSGGGGGSGGSGGQVSDAAVSDAAPVVICPAARPTVGSPCALKRTCGYNDVCTCHGCCLTTFGCVAGAFVLEGSDDGCLQGPPCPTDGGPDGDGDGGGAVCTPGQDQTCNDNPATSSLHGHCTDAGVCVCINDASTNAATGRCP